MEAAGDRTGRPFASYRLRWGFLESEPIFKQESLVSINASVKHLRQVSMRGALGGPGVAWAPHVSGPSLSWGLSSGAVRGVPASPADSLPLPDQS